MAVSDTLLAHRFGYGLAGGRPMPRRPEAQLDGRDATARAFPMPSTQSALDRIAARREEVQTVKNGSKAAQAARRSFARTADQWLFNAARTDLARAVDAGDSFRERLVRFWTDHFSVTPTNALNRMLVGTLSEDAVRPHVAAPFRQMLRAAVLHPAMIQYLDQATSVGPASPAGQRKEAGLNENLARELLELHTLGVQGGYSQTDVRQAALLLTGLAVDGTKGTVFSDRRAEPGAETVLGKSYGSGRKARIEDIHALLDDLAVHPETARHIAGKLAVHFVSDRPDPGLVADLAQVWMRTDGDLGAVSRALASHPAALRPALEKARQPYDFIVASLRALGLDGKDVMRWNDDFLKRTMLNPMIAMGQRWHMANGPDGWEEGFDYWITPQGLANRIDWAMKRPARLRDDLPDPRDFVARALGDLASADLVRLVARAERKAEGVGLVLASPDFNRR